MTAVALRVAKRAMKLSRKWVKRENLATANKGNTCERVSEIHLREKIAEWRRASDVTGHDGPNQKVLLVIDPEERRIEIGGLIAPLPRRREFSFTDLLRPGEIRMYFPRGSNIWRAQETVVFTGQRES